MNEEDKYSLTFLGIVCASLCFVFLLAVIGGVMAADRQASIKDLVKQGQQSDRCTQGSEITVLTYEPTLDDVSWVCVQWEVLFPRK